jgi:hypothetical protein
LKERIDWIWKGGWIRFGKESGLDWSWILRRGWIGLDLEKRMDWIWRGGLIVIGEIDWSWKR